MDLNPTPLLPADLIRLRRMNSPTVYNGWCQVTRRDIARECFNLEPVHDFMPDLAPMVGYAVTVVIEPGNPTHKREKPESNLDYYEYVGSLPGPKIVVVQDLDKPGFVGSFWGEINANIHRALGCVGSIIDGHLRDLDEMADIGFKVLGRDLTVSRAHVIPVRWNCPVEVFGCKIQPGQLIHADKHGFLAIPDEDAARTLASAEFMDQMETEFLMPLITNASDLDHSAFLGRLRQAYRGMRQRVAEHYAKPLDQSGVE